MIDNNMMDIMRQKITLDQPTDLPNQNRWTIERELVRLDRENGGCGRKRAWWTTRHNPDRHRRSSRIGGPFAPPLLPGFPIDIGQLHPVARKFFIRRYK